MLADYARLQGFPETASTTRVAPILPDALSAFDTADIAFVWLTSPNVTLDGLTPFALLLRSDIDAMKVRAALRKIGSNGVK